MITPNLFRSDSYQYDLPEHLIAQHPTSTREGARLMVIDRLSGEIHHDTFANIGSHIPAQTILVVNNTKVIPARLLGKRANGGEVEIFLLQDAGDGQRFEALLRPLKRIKDHEPLFFEGGIEARLIDRERRIVEFSVPAVLERLREIGHIPLPPYINRDDKPSDHDDYQTVYAKSSGSVAAPTAGLHFSNGLIDALKQQGHDFKELTLHINYGTFKPVETDDIREHPMHSERYEITTGIYQDILQAKASDRSVVAVGTTACRVLESVSMTGVKKGSTDIFIYPGYQFRLIDALITNFHLPQSTLLMLVCAFGGYDLIMRAYQEAIKQQYRFYSYGDAMLIK